MIDFDKNKLFKLSPIPKNEILEPFHKFLLNNNLYYLFSSQWFTYLLKTKKITLLLFFFTIIVGCRSLDTDLLIRNGELENKLPAVNQNRFLCFPDEQWISNQKIEMKPYIIDIYNKEMGNIFDKSDEKSGYVYCEIIWLNLAQTYYSRPLVIISIFTLGTINILGFPFVINQAIIEIEFSIFDKNMNEIKKYKIIGKSENPVAAYWGYSPSSTQFYVSAFSDAITKLKQMIIEDYIFLNQRLNSNK
jgi:hypothetical protein